MQALQPRIQQALSHGQPSEAMGKAHGWTCRLPRHRAVLRHLVEDQPQVRVELRVLPHHLAHASLPAAGRWIPTVAARSRARQQMAFSPGSGSPPLGSGGSYTESAQSQTALAVKSFRV